VEPPTEVATALLDQEVVLSSAQLLQHPNLIAIDGVLYNVEAFAPVHPGGAVIRSAGAYDGSAFFHSMHPGRDPLKSTLLQQFRVGVHKRSAEDTVFTYESPFAKDLISSVRKAMEGRSCLLGLDSGFARPSFASAPWSSNGTGPQQGS
jgi:hypothetical protein